MKPENDELSTEDHLKAQYMYWWRQWKRERRFKNSHYEYFFTEYFDIPKSFYEDRKVLDIGCGPRGSLEWMPDTASAVGLDPLAKEYARFGISKHKAMYVDAPAEKIPFPAESFDCVSAFNSLDFVRSVEDSVGEIKRILKAGGFFLLIVEINHKPRADAPHTISASDVESFGFEVLECRTFRKLEEKGCYHSILDEGNLAHNDGSAEMWLAAKLRKKAS
ncbi:MULTISPECIES: class I SAM-dependent methyltransferase [Sinorhizobium]|uniref:class I SAM-dependent methyltransferase n=1 Tax=Sinorhizobium TaxID=28105 RepID=UPI000BE8AAF7|nr:MULTISPECIES: class I SAM-dependent methyltransferase [Sinorhizobium]PDT52745.1 methyltransferase [Sinorhizobium sp. NG07B]POH28916.1 hypothetical protein ATY30_14775 [Sinorhizobium americanum]